MFKNIFELVKNSVQINNTYYLMFYLDFLCASTPETYI